MTLIGIDWGTTRLRAYRIGADGKVLEDRESDRGIANVSGCDFHAALRPVIDGWVSPASGRTPIVMCGMIGSRQGWREVPYSPCPTHLDDVARSVATIETSAGPAWIVGGLSTADGRGHHDILRGEETQIFGAELAAGRQLVVTPGTHSKWAVIRDGTIENFRTYLTGEMYAVLRQHSILGWLMQGDHDPEDHQAAFIDGVREAWANCDPLHSLFTVRTRGLFGQLEPAELGSYLSGVLIGSEITGAMRHHEAGSVTIIAPPRLGGLYRTALCAAGIDVRLVDADRAVARGLWLLWAACGRAP